MESSALVACSLFSQARFRLFQEKFPQGPPLTDHPPRT
jgi:hypothetical protein